MKRNLILSSVLMLGQIVNVKAAPAEGQFAVLKPDYACTVNVPAGRSSSQVYFSKDCQTAYVLPSLNMKKTIIKPYFTADYGICNRFNQTVESLNDVDDQKKIVKANIKLLQAKYATADDSASQESIKKRLDYFKSALLDLDNETETALRPFGKMAALRAQIRVESDMMEELAAFQAANLDTPVGNINGIVYPIRFAPAQIETSLLAISAADKSDLRNQSVLKIDFPGTRFTPAASEKADYPADATLINMNGSMSGIVDISAMTYCSVLKKNSEEFSNDESKMIEIFNSAVALNNEFHVKVQAGVKVKLTSEVKTIDFLNKVEKSVRNELYTRDVFQAAMISGKILNDLKIEVDDKGVELDLAKVIFSDEIDSNLENLNPVVPLINKFISNHLKLVEAKLKSLGLLAELTKDDFVEKQAAITTEVHHYESICSSKRSLFKKSTSCSLQPVYMQVVHSGFSKARSEVADSSVIQQSMTFETNQTTTVKHTSTFGRKSL